MMVRPYIQEWAAEESGIAAGERKGGGPETVGSFRRDINPTNILITDLNVARINDFGLSHRRGKDRNPATGASGWAPCFMRHQSRNVIQIRWISLRTCIPGGSCFTRFSAALCRTNRLAPAHPPQAVLLGGAIISPVSDMSRKWLWGADKCTFVSAWYMSLEMGFVGRNDLTSFYHIKAVCSAL